MATGAVSAPSNYYSGLGNGGGVFAYSDMQASTSVCIAANYLCAKGTTTGGDGTPNVWGAGININLNQASIAAAQNTYSIPSTSTGVHYSVSNIPPEGLRIAIDDAVSSTEYCATVTTASGTIAWSSFNSTCWNNLGTYLTGPPPSSRYLNFQVQAPYQTPGSFNFCVTSVSF